MKSTLYRCALAVLCAGVALAQSPAERVLNFRYAESPASMQEVFNALRSLAEIKDAALDSTARTITLRGPADLVNTGEWFFQQLDRPVRSAEAGPDVQEFRPAGTSDDVLCVYFLSHLDTPQAMQESVNASRSISDMHRVFPISSIRAITMRGSADQVAMGRWVLQELDTPALANGSAMVVHRYTGADPRGPAVRIYFLGNLHHSLPLQEAVNATRSIADVQRFFPVNGSFAITMRGTEAQAELCEWMLAQLDTQGAATAGEYQFPGVYDGVVRVFIAPNASTPQAMQELVNRVRAEARAQRVYPFHSGSAVLFRGTASQVAIAETLISQR
ncbi:MAG TPA: hypothetical protein VNV86_11115 [Candidatus Acidoferrum sp.]|nr:hypothetical protein [Candidatus Acidoferrum sp.]